MKKTLKRFAMLSVAMLLAFAGCEKDPGSEHTKSADGGALATVSTNNVTDITATSAVCGGNVTSDGGNAVTARGICWSTSSNPTTSDNTTYNGGGTGSFTANIAGLDEGTTYYVRAYAVNSQGTAYGQEKSFTTNAYTGTINGYAWVDLGLPSGLKWATCNVGAATPEDYGNYYAWGETTTKSSYTEDNCRTYGVSMNDISGNANYDAARANWGGTWRMPTWEEMEELIDNCTWTWITQSGVKGCKVTGSNGKSIFLPHAGYCEGTSRSSVGEIGSYWSSTPFESDGKYAYDLFFSGGGHRVSWDGRSLGRTVRPVSD